MKTAMQELIEWLDASIETLEKQGSFTIAAGIRAAKGQAYNLLEKEKEQIIEAYGTAICMFYESEQPEEYYNETFNQNK
jgi:hypothetical protein